MDTIDRNEIPPMTHPYGAHWDQPNREEILVDDKHALMTKRTFLQLSEYSYTNPTGTYEGKMWRARRLETDPDLPEWYLKWFGLSFNGDPEMVSINRRIILIC